MTNILITGSNGFLASHLIPILEQDHSLYLTPRPQYDLRREKDIDKLLIHSKPEIIIHLAADVGGLQYNLDNPASIYYNNVMMNTQLIHKAAIAGVKKFIFVSSACAYPAITEQPTKEWKLWQGFPEISNGSYGISKRVALAQLQAYKLQWGMDFEYPILANLYGPGDKSDHVIPMLVKKIYEAKHNLEWPNPHGEIEIWGDGAQTRDFLHVTDAARAIKQLIHTDIGEPVNIANGKSITIKELVNHLIELFDYQGKIVYNMKRPSGQKHRAYSIEKAKKYLDWSPMVDIRDGLQEICQSLKS